MGAILGEENPSFEWSLKPIIIFMKLLGVQVNVSPNISKINKLFMVLLGFIILAVNSALNGASFYFHFNKCSGALEPFSNYTKTYNASLLSPFIVVTLGTHFSDVLKVIGTQAVFYLIFIFSNRWSDVWNSLLFIQKEMNLPDTYYQKLRKHCYLVFFVLALYRGPYLYLSLDSVLWKDLPYIPHEYAVTLANYTRLVCAGILVFFYIIVYAAMLMYKVLNQRLKELAESPNIVCPQMSFEMEKWRRHYDTVCLLAEKINRCFGLVLVLFLSDTFVIMGLYSSKIKSLYQKLLSTDEMLHFFLSVFLPFFFMMFLLIGAYRMQLNGTRFIFDALRQVRSSTNSKMQLQLNSVWIQISRTAKGKVTGMDIVDFDLTIIPTVIVTTLTYAIIVFQGDKGDPIFENLPKFIKNLQI